MMKDRLAFVLALTCGALSTSCHSGHATPEALRPVVCKMDIADTSLGPGDVFDVRVYDEPQLSGIYRVAADGSIAFPLIGTLAVDGETPPAVGKLIQAKLAQGYLRSPQVTIFLREQNSKKVSVLGQVAKPGTFTYTDNMTVIEAVALAGGFTPIAAKNDTVVTRSERGQKVRLQVKVEAISEGQERNFCLRPGDIVFVPERLF
jgi:polysaccharide export outer membrane protein